MKRVFFIFLITFLAFTGCSNHAYDNSQSIKVNQNVEPSPNIKIKTDITLGSSSLKDLKLDDYILVLRLYDGEYYEEYVPGSNYGPNWTGKFKLCIINALNNEVVSSYEMNEWNEFTVKDKITINLADYNNDGNYEFLIGQYGSSNYNVYRMYYITKQLKIGYYENLGEISISDKQYSPLLEVNKEGNLSYSYYDNTKGKNIYKTIDIDLLELK